MNFEYIFYFILSLFVKKLVTDNLPSFHRKDLKSYWEIARAWMSAMVLLAKFFIAISGIIIGLIGLNWVWQKMKVQDGLGAYTIVVALLIGSLAIQLHRKLFGASHTVVKVG